jgi:hypothetical protein
MEDSWWPSGRLIAGLVTASALGVASGCGLLVGFTAMLARRPLPAVLEAPACAPLAAPLSSDPVLDALAHRSADHAAIIRVLEEFAAAYRLHPWLEDRDDGTWRRLDGALLEQLHALAPAASALTDVLRVVDCRETRMQLARALASIDRPDALDAVERLLVDSSDLPLRSALARALPATPAAAGSCSGPLDGARRQMPGRCSCTSRPVAWRERAMWTASPSGGPRSRIGTLECVRSQSGSSGTWAPKRTPT